MITTVCKAQRGVQWCLRVQQSSRQAERANDMYGGRFYSLVFKRCVGYWVAAVVIGRARVGHVWW